MPKPPPGFAVYCAMNGTDKVATDLFAGFESREAVLDWLDMHGIQYRPNGEAFQRAVQCWGEMTGDESREPWATAIHERKETEMPNSNVST